MAPSLGNAPDLAWPLPAGAPGLEVWYGLFGPRDGAWALWVRYTLLSTRSGHRESRLWAGFTERGAPERAFLVTRRRPLGAAWIDRAPFRLALADGIDLEDGAARGHLEGPLGEVGWALSWAPDPVTFTPLRSPALTEAAVRLVGASRHRSVNEAIRVDGEVRIGARRLRLEGAPGHQGHTTGRKLAGAWSWVQCNAFEDEHVAFEALRLGPLTTVCLREGGRVHRLNRVRHLAGRRRSRSRGEVGRWRLAAEDRDLRLTAEVEAPAEVPWQRAAYLSPDDTLRHNAHCSLATVRVTYEVRAGTGWAPPRTLTSRAGRAEWVGRRPPVPGPFQPASWEAVHQGGLHGAAAEAAP